MEFYPIPMLIKLSVSDMESSVNWYQEVLNFHNVFELKGDDKQMVFAHLRGKKYQDIILVKNQPNASTHEAKVILTVEDVHKFEKKAIQFGIKTKITEQPWNAVELELEDPDGYPIILSMRNHDLSFDEVVKRMKF
ncbi:VOC family protein [Bacillus carboniphilus]|uniref:VOC family protein n=1 Tax=Bacillus carboniphilus TaxID=86663 RepID=A0ABY9JRP3_9BACI|nr:VOC family protein [Bacillus carboniphilus]WLR42082.1 VOC family protein [Bacillus carboniphilus]